MKNNEWRNPQVHDRGPLKGCRQDYHVTSHFSDEDSEAQTGDTTHLRALSRGGGGGGSQNEDL